MSSRTWLRVIDLCLALLLAPVWLPLIALAALVALLAQGRPVFYRAVRLGRDGTRFSMLKFRSMVLDADVQGPQVSCASDGRITPLGRLYRKAKLDELPQFLHVLSGEMSMVGPRPESPSYLRYYDDNGRRSLAVKPGITGPGAIFFFFQEESDRLGFEDRYIQTLLPRKLELDAHCADRLALQPLRTTLLMTFYTLVALVCRLASLRPPAEIQRWTRLESAPLAPGQTS